MKMSKRAERALRQSIKKWEAIVDGTGDDEGMDNCALCHLYHPQLHSSPLRPHDCSVCPVARKTGMSFCEGTPYHAYSFASSYETTRTDADGIERDAQWWAERELEFLRSLLSDEGEPSHTWWRVLDPVDKGCQK